MGTPLSFRCNSPDTFLETRLVFVQLKKLSTNRSQYGQANLVSIHSLLLFKGACEILAQAKKKELIILKNKLTAVLTALLLIFVATPLQGKAATQFSDVPSSKHFAEAVYDLAERNIIGGYPDGTFKPGNSITRGQAAAIIAKMIKLDTSNVKNPGFKDVSTANGYYKAIAAMAEKGIISGYGDGRYGPNDPIKRGQMASILVKAFDLPRYNFESHKSPFEDVKRGTGHDPSILDHLSDLALRQERLLTDSARTSPSQEDKRPKC